MTRSPSLVPCAVLTLLVALLLLPGRSPAKDEWQPISPADLALKDNPAAPGAHGMILYRESVTNAADAYETEYERIKIFTEEGKSLGDVEIDYDSKASKIEDIRARTIRTDGSVLNFDGQIFDKEVVKASGLKVLAKTFSLPEVEPGCIIEYKYREQHNTDYYWSIEWPVQSNLFTREARFAIKPDTRPRAPALYWRKYMIPGTAKPEMQKDGTLAMEIQNLPGIEEEDLMPPESAIPARVSFFYRDQDDPQNETPEQFWKRIGKKMSDSEERFIDKKGALQGVVSQTIGAGDSPEVKLQKLYARVQQIPNTGYEVQKTAKEEKREKQKENNNVEDVLKHDSANGHQLNELMVGLARAAGFDSAMIFVAPRSHNSFYYELEDSRQLSADLVWVRLNNTDVFLDPASKYYPYGELPWYETGVNGLKPTKQGADTISVPLSKPADAIRERHADVHLDPDGTLSGTVSVNFLGEWGCMEREYFWQDDDIARKKELTDDVKSWLPGGTFEITEMSGWSDSSQPLHIAGTVRIPGFATQAGHRALVPVTFFRATEPPSFTHETRVNPIYFHYPYTERDSLEIHFPDGLKVETVPAAAKAAPGAGFLYDVSATQDGTGVKMERHLVIGGILFSVDTDPALRRFFNTVKTGDDAQIVLQPAQTSQSR
ncbi:MAG: DUF3857 domain-containing protein [Candidatus Acidiferrales bacterium]